MPWTTGVTTGADMATDFNALDADFDALLTGFDASVEAAAVAVATTEEPIWDSSPPSKAFLPAHRKNRSQRRRQRRLHVPRLSPKSSSAVSPAKLHPLNESFSNAD